MVTIDLTVQADLTHAVQTAMNLPALLFIRRVAATTTVTRVTPDYIRRGHEHSLQQRDIPDYVSIIRIQGPCLFGATDKLTALAPHVDELKPVVILRLRNMTAIDATGLKAIEDFADAVHKSGRALLLCGAPAQPVRMMERAEFHRDVGADNILPSVDAALRRAEQVRPV
jgi:SulP family sulfate permease